MAITRLSILRFRFCFQRLVTPLMGACESGEADAVQALLSAGADRLAEVRRLSRLLGVLQTSNRLGIVLVFVHYCASIELSACALLMSACCLCIWFLTYRMCSQDQVRDTPVTYAAREGHALCLKLLLEHVPKVTGDWLRLCYHVYCVVEAQRIRLKALLFSRTVPL